MSGGSPLPGSMVSAPPRVPTGRGWWWKSLAIGSALWVVVAAVTFLTHNLILMPTLILVGSFLVPCTVALFAVEHASGMLTPWRIAGSFAIGGISGVLAASLLEARLVDDVWVYARVGLIEELVKGVIILAVGWSVRPKTTRQGALLGAVVGAGFAAFESAGYAYAAALGAQGLGLVQVVQTEALRAALTPFGHVLWSAILGAVLFRALEHRRGWRSAASVVVCYAAVAVLHALWDSMAGIAQILAMLATGAGWHFHRYALFFAHVPDPGAATTAANAIYPLGLAVVAFVGVSALQLVVGREQREQLGRSAHDARPSSGRPSRSDC